jgi:hypothetical protein
MTTARALEPDDRVHLGARLQAAFGVGICPKRSAIWFHSGWLDQRRCLETITIAGASTDTSRCGSQCGYAA